MAYKIISLFVTSRIKAQYDVGELGENGVPTRETGSIDTLLAIQGPAPKFDRLHKKLDGIQAGLQQI